MLRRFLDILIAVVLLIACAPILMVAAAAILVLSGRPIIFRQQRAGYRGKQFGMLKLRSMKQNADEILAQHLSINPDALLEWNTYLRLGKDPRHIRLIGRALRKSSIDELPQLWNVLRGDMTLIGPRPLPVDQIERLTSRAREERSNVKPGWTGLWQVVGRGDTTIPTLQRLDRIYIENRSWSLDLWILLRSIPAVFTGRGAY